MKRIVIIVILAVFLPVGMYAQSPSVFISQDDYNALLVVPVPPLATTFPIDTAKHFVNFDVPANNAHNQEGVDYVTVGSLIPYRVKKPLTSAEKPASLTMDYMWLITPRSPNPTVKLDVFKMPTSLAEVTTTVAATPATPAAADYFTNNEISVKMPPQPGMVDLRHRVRYTFKENEMCPPDGTPIYRDQLIQLVPRPSIKLNTGDGVGVGDLEFVGCVDESVTVPTTGTGAEALLLVDGYEDIIIQLKVSHKALETDGGAETVPFNGQWVKLSGKTLEFPGALFTESGVYTIDILNISDRISRKSLDQSLVKSVIEGPTAGLDVPPAGSLKVYILPKITEPGHMEPVQHIRNVPIP